MTNPHLLSINKSGLNTLDEEEGDESKFQFFDDTADASKDVRDNAEESTEKYFEAMHRRQQQASEAIVRRTEISLCDERYRSTANKIMMASSRTNQGRSTVKINESGE